MTEAEEIAQLKALVDDLRAENAILKSRIPLIPHNAILVGGNISYIIPSGASTSSKTLMGATP